MGEGEEWVLIRLSWSGAAPQKANLGNKEIPFITLSSYEDKKVTFIGCLFYAEIGFLISFSQLPYELDIFQRIKQTKTK